MAKKRRIDDLKVHELVLAAKAATDERQRQQHLTDLYQLITPFIKRHVSRSFIDHDDATSCANWAFQNAVDIYDPAKGAFLSLYAKVVRNQMYSWVHYLRKPKRWAAARPVSLSHWAGDSNDMCVLNMFPDTKVVQPLDELVEREQRARQSRWLRASMKLLSPVEQYALFMTAVEGLSYEEAAAEINRLGIGKQMMHAGRYVGLLGNREATTKTIDNAINRARRKLEWMKDNPGKKPPATASRPTPKKNLKSDEKTA